MRTVLSCEADAIYDLDSKVGAHATSRTQSVWPESVTVRLYVLSVGLSVVKLVKSACGCIKVEYERPKIHHR